MSEFNKFNSVVNAAFKTLVAHDTNQNKLFVVDVTGDELYAHYLASFPEGSNPMFRERTEHDCSTCRSFIKNIGDLVMIENGVLTSVWDGVVEDPVYSVVSKAMSEFVKSKAIKAPFFVTEPKYGALFTTSGTEKWNHFVAEVPRKYIARHNDSNAVGMKVDSVNVLRRSIVEISDDAVNIVAELLAQGSLYRGPEFQWVVDGLLRVKREYNALKTDRERELYLWSTAQMNTRYRATVIGTLLCDISEGVEIERAVASYEAKVAPTNYKRTTALVTQRMIDEAKKVVDERGLEPSLFRRYATPQDITVNNVLYVNGKVKPKLLGGAFDVVTATKQNVPSLKNIEQMNIADFINNVLPKADEVEMFVRSQHANNFVSLIAPVHADCEPLFKWDNAFSWSYDGEVTDSIKERVKRAGGKVDGAMRVSLSWFNGDDLDLSVEMAGKGTVYFGNRSNFGAQLDVDMNAGGARNSIDPVENIVWSDRHKIQNGEYTIMVHNFAKRSTGNGGFVIEVEIEGKMYSFTRVKALPDRDRVEVGTITVRGNTITVRGLEEGSSSIEKWGIKTEEWVPVDMITRSPNFWDDKKVGNEHIFFMLKGCVNPDGTRGFYNEFLRDDLTAHRKVFEVLASNLKVAYNENQLSGIGISTTKKEEVVLRVKGSINRVINVTF